MAKAKKETVAPAGILDLLPEARRQEIIAEALGGQVAQLIRENRDSTLEEFVAALQEHEHWENAKQLKVSSVLQAADGASAIKRQPAARTRAPRIDAKTAETVRAYVQKNPGKRLAEIQAGIKGLSPDEVARALAKLRRDKQVKTQGERRSTTYSAS